MILNIVSSGWFNGNLFPFFTLRPQELSPNKVKKLREELDSLDRLMEETEHFVFQQKEQLKHLKVFRNICVCIPVYLSVCVLFVYDVFSWRYKN